MRNTQPHIFAMSLFKLIEEKSISLKTEKKEILSANNFRFGARLPVHQTECTGNTRIEP